MDLPFRAGGDLYAPRPEPKLGHGLSSKLLLVVFDGRSDARGPFELDTQFLNASGAAVDFGPTQIKKLVRDGSSRRLLVTVTPSGVPPGDYTLKAVLRDASDGTEAPITQRLHVE
jgi:hypothetical protein